MVAQSRHVRPFETTSLRDNLPTSSIHRYRHRHRPRIIHPTGHTNNTIHIFHQRVRSYLRLLVAVMTSYCPLWHSPLGNPAAMCRLSCCSSGDRYPQLLEIYHHVTHESLHPNLSTTEQRGTASTEGSREKSKQGFSVKVRAQDSQSACWSLWKPRSLAVYVYLMVQCVLSQNPSVSCHLSVTVQLPPLGNLTLSSG